MYCNNLLFPNDILQAIKSDTFVVFAGAGASVDPPTSLPNFEKLAKEIAEGTGETLTKNVSCEVFLGKLKTKGIPVNEQAAKILSSTCLEHNKLHEAIIDLFPSTKSIKIVTTNYDQMFEHVLKSRGITPVVYDCPALPLGSDVQGIIHIHGNVDNYKYMVVTDDDFGKAYLTDGYVSRFLVQLFETYTVLFIGYSYNDTILRYLTRAMSRYNSGKKFILTDDTKSDWDALGINSIPFPKRSYAVAREGLIKLGLYVKKDLLDWKNQFSSMTDAPPKDLTLDSEIEYCLNNKEINNILVSQIHGKEWIDYLDKKKVFDECFSKDKNLSERSRLWGSWLCSNFVGSEDDILMQLFLNHSNTVNDEFATILVIKLINRENIKPEILTQYVFLVENKISESWIITKLVERLYNNKQYKLGFRLYKKLFETTFSPHKISSLTGSYDYTHIFRGKPHEISQTWRTIEEETSSNFSNFLIAFVQEKIIEIHSLYSLVNENINDYEPAWMRMLVIEEREEPVLMYEDFHTLVQMYLKGAFSLQEQNQELLKSYLSQGIHSNTILLRKTALKTIRLTNVFTASEKLEIILDENTFDEFHLKEQVFLLAKSIFNELSTKEKNRFIDQIERLNNDSDNSYKVFHWCEWLQEASPNNRRVKNIMTQILSQHQYPTNQHPEREDYIISGWRKDESPFSEEEFKHLSIKDAVDYLTTYNGVPIHGPNRYGLLDILSACVTTDYRWTIDIVSELTKQKIKKDDIWNHVFEGLNNANLKEDETIEILALLSAHISECKYVHSLSNYLFHIVSKGLFKNTFSKYENELFHFAEVLWKNRSHAKPGLDRTIDVAINSTIGNLLITWIYFLSYSEELTIPPKYKDFFEKALRLHSWERNVAICVLVGHFNFFCYRDKEWAEMYLISYLNRSEKNTFSSAWEGIIHFSRRIDTNTVDILTPVFYKAIKNIKYLEDYTKHGFIELLLTLLIHVIDKPTYKYIPELYKYASKEDICLFIHTIERRIANYDDIENKKWWDKWLKRFLENRKNNKPTTLSDSEFSYILNLLPELDFVFEEAVSIICKGSIPSKIDNLFWHSLYQKKLTAKYPNSVATVVIKVLNSIENAGPFDTDIKRIIEDLDGIDDKKKKQIQEAALKHSIFLK